MSKTPKSGKEWIVKAGSIIKIDGLPYTVTTNIVVHGFRKPEWLKARLTKSCAACSLRSHQAELAS